MPKILFYLLIFISTGALAQQDSLMIYYRSGLAAYEKSSYDEYFQAFKRANEIRPGHPTLIYQLACASALSDRKDHALARLRELLLMNAELELQKDENLKSLWDDPRFMELLELQIELSDTIRTSKEVFSMEANGFHPESITYYEQTQQFFFGDIRSRRIMVADIEGNLQEWLPTTSDIYSVMGIAINETKNELWAVTAALPEMKGYSDSLHANKSSLLVLDMATKALKAKWLFDNKIMGGITMGPKGNILISDLKNNQIWEVASMSEGPKIYKDLSNHFFNIQGMTYNEEGTILYLSDYITGLYYLDEAMELHTLRPPKQVSYKGFDGLYFHQGTLFATQNGTRPMRVYQFELDQSETSITSAQLLDQSGLLNEPTTGTFTKDRFLFIANSPWGAYDKERNFNPIGPVIILSQSLK